MNEKELLDQLNNSVNKNTLIENLGIVITRFTGDQIEAKMPVDERTVQPFNVLHGGATATLAETLGSFGSHLNIDTKKFKSVGLEINVNHLRSASSGWVTGKANIVHKGRKTHVWTVDVFNDEDKLIATSRMTVMILPV